MGYSFRLAARVLLYAPFHRQDNTYHGLCYTCRWAVAGTRNSSMGPPWRIDPTTHRTMSVTLTTELHLTPRCTSFTSFVSHCIKNWLIHCHICVGIIKSIYMLSWVEWDVHYSKISRFNHIPKLLQVITCKWRLMNIYEYANDLHSVNNILHSRTLHIHIFIYGHLLVEDRLYTLCDETDSEDEYHSLLVSGQSV